MGYTHYWSDLEVNKYSEGLISIFNQAYQDFLRSGVTIDGTHINLFSIFFKMNEDENLFDEHFHEYCMGASGEPLLFPEKESWNFCKTNRKSYDVAVVLSLHLASVILDKRYSSDGFVIPEFVYIGKYIQDELDDSMIYDLEKLKELFDIWLNKAISFIAENGEEMQKIEDNKQYSRICDLPDHELEYIGEQIKKGITSLYLNNGQIVDIGFRN